MVPTLVEKAVVARVLHSVGGAASSVGRTIRAGEMLSTTRLPYAIQFLSAELKHSGLLSSGFSLIFGLMRIPNLTHGSLFMLGAYIGASLVVWYKLDFWLAAIISALLVALGARLWDEILGLDRRESVDWSEQMELDQTVLPGISIRS